MKIFINPGHGGNDPGSCGNNLREADVALKIGNRVADYLRAVGYDVKVFQFDGLSEICDDANNWHADLFVSIHCNAFDGIAHGSETYCHYGAEQGRKLATAIHNQIISSIPVVDRGVKERGYVVLSGTNMTAVLVETAFIDNPGDAKLLVEREDEFARAIARGVTDYFADTKPVPDVIDNKSATRKLSAHFDASEFVCHCCGQGSVVPRLIELLEQLRNIVNAPVHVNCGYRCPKHNAEVGGVTNSQHIKGTAADITIPQIGFDKAKSIVQSLDFDGTGFYPPIELGGAWFIHVDTRNGGIGSHIEFEK